MDLDLRLSTLGRLVASETLEAKAVLGEEFQRVQHTLNYEHDFDLLEVALAVLAVIAPRFSGLSMEVLEKFVVSIQSRPLTYAKDDHIEVWKKYKTSATLTAKAISVASGLRYLETRSVVRLLLAQVNVSPDEEVRRKAIQSLREVAAFDLRVFYGDEQQRGIGPYPQLEIVKLLEEMSDEELKQHRNAIFEVLSEFLSPSMQGTSWSYKSIKFSRSGTPAIVGVIELRKRSIALAIRLYEQSETVPFRRSAVRCLVGATRRERVGDSQMNAMFVENSLDVLSFFASIVSAEAMPIVQVIEHDTYWIYHHGGAEVKAAALRLHAIIESIAEYQIYKILVGFEGIFGDWENLSRNDAAWDTVDTKRRAAAKLYVEQINEANFAEWRKRILEFAKTESDDLATFPIFFTFLEDLAVSKPHLSIELVREDVDALKPVLIPLIRGLWQGEWAIEMQKIAEEWVAKGRNLPSVAKSLYKVGHTRLPLLAKVVRKAAELGNEGALDAAMGVSASLHREGATDAGEVFMAALREMTVRKNALWAVNFWHTEDIRSLVLGLPVQDTEAILQNLKFLSKVNHQSEEVLSAIAEVNPRGVLQYLLSRLEREETDNETPLDKLQYEAIPYQLDRLRDALAKIVGDVVRALRSFYERGEKALFTYRGARLLHAIFPTYVEALEMEMLKLVGRGEEGDLYFVVSVLRNYEGSPTIYRTCKALIKAVPSRAEIWNEVAAAIESTGVVHGQYGFAEAFERKKSELASWLEDPDSRVREFANWLSNDLEKMAKADRRRGDESLALRKYQYGDDLS